ncbi:hypothetical protein [Natrinema amylolyticum]|nr:hypothetical protein [Natrinema amylolyticum]
MTGAATASRGRERHGTDSPPLDFEGGDGERDGTATAVTITYTLQ